MSTSAPTTASPRAGTRPGARPTQRRKKCLSVNGQHGFEIHSGAGEVALLRRATYRLYPNQTQARQLRQFARLHCELYNAALQERRDAWRIARRSVTFFDQSKQLPALKKLRPELVPLGDSLAMTLRRVDHAYRAFFRRVRDGGGPAGFPRFKASNLYPGWSYASANAGWKLLPRTDGKHGRIFLRGIGWMRVRGGSRNSGYLKSCTILRRADKWYASIVLESWPERHRGTDALGLDWGVAHFATLSDGTTIANPRLLERDLEKLSAALQVLARKKRGSRRRAKAKLIVHRLHEKIRNRRDHFLHQVSADLVDRASLLATEKLATKNLTRSAAGTVEEPGNNVAQKAGLNRAILDTAPATFLALLRYKAAEAGVPLVEVDTKTVKPSQTCPACGAVAKKKLSERVHRCPCGAELPRDQAAALVCLGVALTGDARGAWPPASLRSAGSRHRSETTACGGQDRGAAAPGGEVGSPPPPVCLKNDAMLPLSPGDVANDEDHELLEEDA